MFLPEGVECTLRTLRTAGHEAYLVGGCVRETLRGKAPADYDLTTSARPEQVMAIFGAHAHPTGLVHGTVTVSCGGTAVEVTTFRCDGTYSDGRHPDRVHFTASITDDLARRDFTVNAIAMDERGQLIDPFGGQNDLQRGILRCVGDAPRRFGEDALRILRLLRFASVLGFSVEDETARAAHAARENLACVSHERVFAELDKLLRGAHTLPVLLAYPDILGIVLPEIMPCVGFDQRNPHHCYDVWQHTAHAVAAVPEQSVLRWTMLFHDLGKPATSTIDAHGVGHYHGHTALSAQLADGIMQRLHFPRVLREGVSRQLACFDEQFLPERVAVHRAMTRLGKDATGLLLQTKLADNAAKAPNEALRSRAPWLEALAQYNELCAERACCAVGDLAIGGGELAALGYRGRQIGHVLMRLLDEVAAEKLKNEHGALLARAGRLYRSGYLIER